MHTFRTAGSTRGVDQRRETVWSDRGDDRIDNARLISKLLHPRLSQVGPRHHPPVVAVGATVGTAVENHDPLKRWQFSPMRSQFVDLRIVLGKGDTSAGVRQDVGNIRTLGRGVNRSCGSTGAHHCQVGQDPFVASSRDDRDAFFWLDAKGQQPGGQVEHLPVHLVPGQ